MHDGALLECVVRSPEKGHSYCREKVIYRDPNYELRDL